MLTGQSGLQTSTAGRVTGSLLQDRARPGTRREKRAYARQSIESCRTIAGRRW